MWDSMTSKNKQIVHYIVPASKNESERLFIAPQWSEPTLPLQGGSQKLDAQIPRATSNHVFTRPLNYCLLA